MFESIFLSCYNRYRDSTWLLTLLQQVTAFVLRVAHYSYITFIMGLCNIECIERIAQYLDVSSKGLEISNKNVSVIHLINVFKV